jgi:hypothetical protein
MIPDFHAFIFSLGPVLTGGSKKTAEFAVKQDKPCLHGVLRLARNLFRWFPQKLPSFVFGVLFGDLVESSSSMVSRQ